MPTATDTPLWAFHLPGKHDQNTHGRGRGGVRRSLARATDVKTLNEAGAAEAKRITGRTVAVDMAGSDLKVAKEHLEGIMQGLERYPKTDVGFVGSYGPGGAAPRVLGLSVHGESYAVTVGSAVYFNNRHAAHGVAYRRALTEEPPIRSQVARDPRGVALHEFGHCVSSARNGTATRVAQRSAQQADESVRFHVVRHISSYANSDDAELGAEAFADVMINGAKASPLSAEITSALTP